MLSHRDERHLNADPRIKERNRKAATTTWKRIRVREHIFKLAFKLLGRVATEQELARLALYYGHADLLGTKWFVEVDWEQP